MSVALPAFRAMCFRHLDDRKRRPLAIGDAQVALAACCSDRSPKLDSCDRLAELIPKNNGVQQCGEWFEAAGMAQLMAAGGAQQIWVWRRVTQLLLCGHESLGELEKEQQ